MTDYFIPVLIGVASNVVRHLTVKRRPWWVQALVVVGFCLVASVVAEGVRRALA